MAPTIPIDYAGHKESRKFSKTVLGDMGKTRKVSKGYSSGFVPDYRHVVETVAESEGFGRSGLQDPCVPNRKSISLNLDGYDRSVVPMRYLALSEMSPLERRDLDMMLKSELEQVRKLQRKMASFSLGAIVPPTTDIQSHQNGQKRPATVESLRMPASDVPMKKKSSSGENGPRVKGGVLAARRMEPVKQGPQSTNFVMLMNKCETLLKTLMSQKNAWLFNKPVDVVAHNIPDYFNVIKHPMDLGTVKSKLQSNKYTSPMQFAADVRLTFNNAMTFNPPDNLVHGYAMQLGKFFEVRWKSIEKKLPSTADDSTASKSSVIIEPESAYVPPAKKQKTTSRETKVKHEIDKRVMNAFEKQKLGAELEALIAELPDNIINFLKESTLSSSQVTEDEIEIDIDALNDDTLFTLRGLLDDYLQGKKKQSTFEHHENEMRKESGSRDLPLQPCKDNDQADEDVDICGNDPPPVSSSPSIQIDKDAARRNSNCSSSRSSGESGSSSTDSDSGSSSASEQLDGANSSVPAKETADSQGPKESDLGDPNSAGFLNMNAEQYSVSNSSAVEPNCRQEGESAPPERQVSPEKLYRAALLRSRFADIIIKAQETTEKGEKPDPEKLKLEREELERRRREEKARLQAEAKAAEEARRKAEVEAAEEAKRKRKLEREAARQALQKMEKTVEINENSHFMEDLEMLTSAPDEPLQSLIDKASPENSQNALGSFKFRANSNPLEQLGLYMKNDEEEDEDVEPQSTLHDSNDTEEGEID
ncbi:hypothetical protein ACS0TY_030456 [Phlomoides rotata]